jgi:hypothetical protein
MGVPISIRVDDIRDELEHLAKLRHVGISTLLRDIVTGAVHEAKRARIRQASAEIGAHVAGFAEGQAFYDEWGTPRADAG